MELRNESFSKNNLLCTKFLFFSASFICIALLFGIHLEDSYFHIKTNHNYRASLLRDRDEIRLSEMRSMIYNWRVDYGLPLTYDKLLKHYNITGTGVKVLPNLNTLYITHNRLADRIDAYNPHYIEQTLHSLHEELINEVLESKQRRFDSINICLCTIIQDNDNLQSYIQTRELLPEKNYFKVLKKSSFIFSYHHDKALCMKEYIDANPLFKAGYLIVVEDDMLPVNKFFHKLYEALSQIEDRNYSDDASKKLFIQLFDNQKEHKYSLEDINPIIYELGPLGIIVAVLIFFLFFRPVNSNILRSLFTILCLFQIFIFFGIMIGRPHILNAYVKISGFLNIPILKQLYSPNEINKVSAYLVNFPSSEIFISELSKLPNTLYESTSKIFASVILNANYNFEIFKTNPSMFNDIGLYSSVVNGTVDPYLLKIL